MVVTTPSKVAFQSVRRLLVLFKEMGINVTGVVENMVMKPGDYIKKEVAELEVDYLGGVDYCEELEEALGDPTKLAQTCFYKKIGELSPKII